MNIKRGKVFLANLDPTIGGEIKKIRPVLVISNDINNRNSIVVTIIPITSNVLRIYPFEVLIEKGLANLPKESKIKADQIRSIDKSRILKEIGELPSYKILEVEKALRIHLDMKH